MRLSRRVTKLCPYKDEVDEGSLDVELYILAGDGPELHTLAELLDSYADVRISHESYVEAVAEILAARNISVKSVKTEWTTAGFAVAVDYEP